MRKKWLCSLLTAALLLSLFPTAALADEDGPDASAEGVVETVAEEQAVVDPELLEMLSFANAAASLVTAKKGALRSMPDPEEIRRLVAEGAKGG